MSSLDLSAGAVLGTVKYREAYYGRPLQDGNTPLPTYSVLPISARAINYFSIQVTWVRPTNGTNLRLVRNSFGFSSNSTDGLIIRAQATQDSPWFVDATLSPEFQGQFLYYTVWNQSSSSGPWWRAGDIQAILPKNWGYGDMLKSMLPAYLFDMDDTLASGQSPIF